MVIKYNIIIINCENKLYKDFDITPLKIRNRGSWKQPNKKADDKK